VHASRNFLANTWSTTQQLGATTPKPHQARESLTAKKIIASIGSGARDLRQSLAHFDSRSKRDMAMFRQSSNTH
jgi:hypothetical protein